MWKMKETKDLIKVRINRKDFENLNQIRTDRRTVELTFSWEGVLNRTWISPWTQKRVYYVKRITRKRSITYVFMNGEISV